MALKKIFKRRALKREEVRVLSHQNIYLFPTRFGGSYLLFLLLLMILAINFNNALIYILLFWLLGFFIVSLLITWSNLVAISIRALPTTPLFVGEEGQFLYEIKGGRRSYYGITLIGDEGEVRVNVLAGEEVNIALPHRVTRRGLILPGRIRLATEYPLGIARAWSYFSSKIPLLCYPKPLKNSEFGRTAWAGERSIGEEEEQGVDDFSGLEIYQKGDNLRHIHWPAYAKGQGLYVKSFTQGVARELWIDFSFVSGSIEERLSKMCYLLLEADQRGVEYGFILEELYYPPARGSTHLHRCLRALALY